jgi:hypothetical protein
MIEADGVVFMAFGRSFRHLGLTTTTHIVKIVFNGLILLNLARGPLFAIQFYCLM